MFTSRACPNQLQVLYVIIYFLFTLPAFILFCQIFIGDVFGVVDIHHFHHHIEAQLNIGAPFTFSVVKVCAPFTFNTIVQP